MPVLTGILYAGLAVLGPFAAAAQQQQPAPPPMIPGVNPTSSPDEDHDPAFRHITEQMAIRRNAQRQQQIVSDTARLLQLAQKLNSEVSKSSKDTLSVSVVKEADEIEKLAKTIKQRMRDGQ